MRSRCSLPCLSAVLAVALCSAAACSAQAPAAPAGPPSIAAEVQRAYAAVKPNILKSADLMPADQYGVKPTPEVRTYARVLTHITEAQFRA